jgi:hypothetical protein
VEGQLHRDGWLAFVTAAGLIGQGLHVSRYSRTRSKFNQPILSMTNTSKRRKKMLRFQISIRLQLLEDGITVQYYQRGSRLTLFWPTMSNTFKT